MRTDAFSMTPVVLSLLVLAIFLPGTASGGQQYTVLHDFTCEGLDGCEPNGGLVFDGAGNLYGTTVGGGTYSHGTIFELSPKADGGWKEEILHSFNDDGKDGYLPYAGVIIDSARNLYGTTTAGGTHGTGTVFSLSPKEGGGWREQILFSFNSYDNTQAGSPYGGLIADTSGNLYGTTVTGGKNYGSAFELSPSGDGTWTWTLLAAFNEGGFNGLYPYDALTFDAAGNLYGTTSYGGIYDGCSQENAGFFCGTVFEISPVTGGGWAGAVLYSFGSVFDGYPDGYYPDAGVIFDAKGNFYGTTPYGGKFTSCLYQDSTGCGTAFELSPSADGNWKEKVIHNFGSYAGDGALPSGGLIIDKSGNLYGTTQMTGVDYSAGYGTVFKLSPTADAGWSEKILHNFVTGKRGATPSGNLTMDSAGNLYGAADVIFEITP